MKSFLKHLVAFVRLLFSKDECQNEGAKKSSAEKHAGSVRGAREPTREIGLKRSVVSTQHEKPKLW